jgi:hypothetical protein
MWCQFQSLHFATCILLLILIYSCKNYDLAKRYFPQAVEFMPRPAEISNLFRTSGEFDFESIMIYGSHMGKRDYVDWYPLTTTWTQPIYMGGALLPQDGGLSQLDIERIAALYPNSNLDPQLLPGLNLKRSGNASALPAKQHTLEFIVPGVLTTTVKPVPLPTDLPKLKKGRGAGKLPNPCGSKCPGDMDVQ